MRRYVRISPTLLALAGVLALTGLGCSGGDSGGGGVPSGLTVTVTGFSSPAPGVICASFEVSGGSANALVNLVAEYVRLTNATTEIPATPISANFATQNGLDITLGTSGEVTLNGSGEFTTGQFYWWAGQDLGFIQDSVRLCLTPVNPLTSAEGTAGCTVFFVYDAGQPSTPSTGSSAGTGVAGQPVAPGTGRAGHTAHAVRGSAAIDPSQKNVIVAGGYNNAAMPNAFSSADRFRFGTTNGSPNGTHTNPFGQLLGGRKVLHASSYFIDPSTNGIKVLVSGGVDGSGLEGLNPGAPDLLTRIAGASAAAANTADVYCFAPESLTAVAPMNVARFAHTATWVPECNAVVIIGGANLGTPTLLGTLSGTDTIEVYDPAANTWTSLVVTLNQPRVEHSATLLADGRILVFGGYDPANPTVGLNPEVFDPVNETVTEIMVTGVPSVVAAFARTGHTATRLFDGRVLIAGGRDLTGTLLDSALLITPTSGPLVAPNYSFTQLTMRQARARHAATVLGTGLVLFTGGVSLDAGMSAEFTNAAEIFNPSFVVGPVPFTNPFSAVNFMTEARAEHTMTAAECGSVFIIGGRNADAFATPNFLDTIEFYAFSNAIPALSGAMTATTTLSSMLAINFTVADPEADGGYVTVRFREAGSTKWRAAVIDSQVGPNAVVTAPATGRVTTGNHQFIWNYTANAVPSGTLVDIQLVPVGATIGSALEFSARIP